MDTRPESEMIPEEWEWEALAGAALEAYASAREEEACHLWRQAGDLASALPGTDPRRAASTSNVGLSRLVQGHPSEAREALEEALRQWALGPSWIDAMGLAVGARSSLFHMRMEQRHGASYQAFRRSRYGELLQGGKAMSQFNLAIALLQLDEDAAADALLAEAIAHRRQAIGDRDPALALMLGVLAGRSETIGRLEDADRSTDEARRILDAPARSALELWTVERPRELNDERRLLAAAYLTAPLHRRDIG